MIIAVKYAYTSPIKINELRASRIPIEKITGDFIMVSWAQQ
jgi:hypothetical protein